jgi:hypothetical protein
MKVKKQATDIQKVIKSYAKAYGALQEYQENSSLIPLGDQKTGCIGEFYVYLFLQDKFPKATLTYGNHSQKGWDIKLTKPDKSVVTIQVKTVSAYSKTRQISPIHHGWNELHLVYLDRGFQPLGYWIVDDRSIVKKGDKLMGRKIPVPEKEGTGSKGIPFGDNLVHVLKKATTKFERK